MIASLSGVVDHVGLDRLVVLVGGVGLLVHTTPATAGCRPAPTVRSHQPRGAGGQLDPVRVRDAGERDMFETVQTVTGVGPRLALAMLSVHGPVDYAPRDRRRRPALTKIPGVGRKSAERPRPGVARQGRRAPRGRGRPAAHDDGHRSRDQVTEALVGLGWNAKGAGDAVDKVAARPDAPTEVAALLRAALRELGR
jgi:Holliday junction DNA helicase RuvA